jgi:hypothetical protein
MLQHLREVSTVDPAFADRAANEMLGLVRRRIANAPADGREGSCLWLQL